MARRTIAVLVAALGMLLATVGIAAADTTDIIQPNGPVENPDQGFQAGTCTVNEVNPTTPCSPWTPTIFFNTAAGHPPIGFTQYTIEHEPYEPNPLGWPEPSLKAEIPPTLADHTIRTLRTDLPPGLTVNPEATEERCTLEDFLHKNGEEKYEPLCDEAKTKVGEQRITLVTNNVPNQASVPLQWYVIPPQPGGTKITVFNLVPEPGEPAKLGFIVNQALPVFLKTQVAWESDFHESFTINLFPNTSEITGLSTLISRLVTSGRSGDGTYLTTPTTCFDPNEAAYEHLYSTWFRAHSYGEEDPEFPNGSTPVESKIPREALTPGEVPPTGPRFKQEDCANVPFDPSIETSVTTSEVDSPTGGTIDVKLPFDPEVEGDEGQSQSHVRKAEVTLPAGMGLNPSGSIGLVACTDAQFKKGVRVTTNECPAASKVGHAVVESPPLHEPLEGDVYVGEQKSSDPESGEQFRILVEAKSEAEGIVARLIGNVKANKATGQLTGVFTDQIVGPFAGELPDGLPQVPFESVKLTFDASKRVLTSPPTCSASTTNGAMEPWARPGTTEPVSDTFTLTSVPGGGACPTTLAERKFTPSYDAATGTPKAGAYSSFHVHLGRTDGQQELKGATVTLPKGLTGKLAGIPYCSEAAIVAAAAAAGKSGVTCPAESRLGIARTNAGTGSPPLSLAGTAYLAGPYKGAPLSMVVVTPAVSGPFDLGTVVVRVALNVHPETAQITAVSDVIPDVFGGVKLDIRAINVDIDRPEFMKVPTSCSPQATTGTLSGGGADPTNPAAFSAYPVSTPYQANQCRDLGFKPKFFTRLTGPTKRDGNPRLRAIVEARDGDANIDRTALTLPSSLFLDQSHIRTVCTRAQLASKTCPRNSIYGQAEAKTPLLDEKLKGPVYLVANPNTELPNLLADLRGQVNIQLRGIISSKRGGLKTVFNGLPDVPVEKFILNMRGGDKSLLVNSRNTCKEPQRAVLNMRAQNSRLMKNNKFRLNIASCKGKRR